MQSFEYKPLSWNVSQWQRILAKGPDRLPHAMLLTGASGLGKRAFAEAMAALLLCEAPVGGFGESAEANPAVLHACGKCAGCRWLAGGNHPDFRRLGPGTEDEEAPDDEAGTNPKEKKKAAANIPIAAIRALEDFVFVGSHRDGRRVIVITEAEAMQGPAANALLKILEEPPASVYFILVSSRPRTLLPTIRSRCRAIPFSAPAAASAQEWIAAAKLPKDSVRFLDLAAGAPLRVAQWHEQQILPSIEALIASLAASTNQAGGDPTVLAARWDALLKKDLRFTLEVLVEGVQRWLFDLAQEAATEAAGSVRYHTGWPRPRFERPLSLAALTQAWRDLLRFRRSARHPLNQLLFLEDLAAHTLRGFRPTSS